MVFRKQKTKRFLKQDLRRVCLLFAICISVSVGAVGFAIYYLGISGEYERTITGILHYTSESIDGDAIAQCLNRGNGEGQLINEQLLMDKVWNSFDVTYIYIVKPLGMMEQDNIMYIIEGGSEKPEEIQEKASFGELSGDEFSPKVAEQYLRKMNDHTDKVTFFKNHTTYGYLYTGMITILDSSGNPVAILAADITMEDLYAVLRRFIVVILIGSIVLARLFLSLMYRWTEYRVINPLSRIGISASSFVDASHMEERPEALTFDDPKIQTGDEVEQLSKTIMTMASDMKNYMERMLKEQAEKERTASELEVARRIQASMLPHVFPVFPEIEAFDLFSMMEPAKEVGGDFYDLFLIDNEHLGLVMADVSGKGIPAALFMAMSRMLVKNQAYSCQSPARVLFEVNNQLCKDNAVDMFVTIWLGILNYRTGRMKCANAGHEYPIIKRAGGQFELFQDPHGMVCAAVENIAYQEYEMQFSGGDMLFLYTDGVPEATDAANELYGTNRLLDCLNKSSGQTPEALIRAVRNDMQNFVGDAPQFDDITMMCLKYQRTE